MVFKQTFGYVINDAIHKYNPTTNSWDHISNMPTTRWLSFVAVLPTNEIMVVGGSKIAETNVIEFASFSCHAE